MSAVSSCLQKNTKDPKNIKQIHLHPKTEYISNIIIHAKPWDYNPFTHTPTTWQPLTHMINVQLIRYYT